MHKLHGRAPLLCVVISADAFHLEYESERPGSDSIFSVALGNDVTGMKKTKMKRLSGFVCFSTEHAAPIYP